MGTPMVWGIPMFGNVTALEGLHVIGKYRNRSMPHTCSRHVAWDSHILGAIHTRAPVGALSALRTRHTLRPLAWRWSHFPTRLTNLPGQWLQCQAEGSNVCRDLRRSEQINVPGEIGSCPPNRLSSRVSPAVSGVTTGAVCACIGPKRIKQCHKLTV